MKCLFRYCLSLGAVMVATVSIYAQPPHLSIRAAVPLESGTQRHKDFAAQARAKDYHVVFFGDSGTGGWTSTGKEVWASRIEPLRAGVFGVGGQPIGHLLWRLQNGLLEGYRPKVVVLWIGHVNLLAGAQGPELAEGIGACVEEIRKRQPQAKVIVMALFAQKFSLLSEANVAAAKEANRRLAMLAGGDSVRILDPNPALRARMKDLTDELARVKDPHRVTLFYRIWADAIEQPLKEMLK